MGKPASQGSKLADKETYTGASDRRLQLQLTQETKIASDFFLIRAFLRLQALLRLKLVISRFHGEKPFRFDRQFGCLRAPRSMSQIRSTALNGAA